MRRRSLLTAFLAVSLAGALAAPAAPAKSIKPKDTDKKAEKSYYVALGDSLSAGFQPTPDGGGKRTNNGYVDGIFKSKQKEDENLRLKKLGCPGESSTTLLAGGICGYKGGSQMAAAESFLKQNKGDIAFVTIALGANDVVNCGATGSVDIPCLNNGLAAIDKNLPQIVSRLRKAAGKKTRIVAMTYYDPFLQFYLRGGDTNKSIAQLSVTIAKDQFNSKLVNHYLAGKFKIADVATAFGTYVPFEQTTNLAGFGTVPIAVARICELTFMCTPAPQGPDVHANNTGYKLIAKTFLKRL